MVASGLVIYCVHTHASVCKVAFSTSLTDITLSVILKKCNKVWQYAVPHVVESTQNLCLKTLYNYIGSYPRPESSQATQP